VTVATYSLKDNALCGPVVRISPGVSKGDLPAYVGWQVVSLPVSLHLLESGLSRRAPGTTFRDQDLTFKVERGTLNPEF